uniref:Uncharacterized protein n=1 Tax=Corvus moneduloides TaxID=1196302 RepID=A0A8C3EIY8_CORMO
HHSEQFPSIHPSLLGYSSAHPSLAPAIHFPNVSYFPSAVFPCAAVPLPSVLAEAHGSAVCQWSTQPGHGDQTQLLLEWEGTFGNLVGGTINTFINVLTDQGVPSVCSPCRSHIGVSTQRRSYVVCILISTCPANKSASVEPH